MATDKDKATLLTSLLHHSQDWQVFKILANALPQIVWTGNPDGTVDYYNEKWFSYTGLTYEQTQGWGWGPILHPDDLPLCIEKWEHAIATSETYEIEYRFKRGSDGTYRWHLGRALPVKDKYGKIVKWIGTSTDIDDQKRAQLTLQNANVANEKEIEKRTAEIILINTQLQTILDANPHAIIATDLQGTIKVFSKAAEKMLGFCAEEVVNKKKATAFHDHQDLALRANHLSKQLQKNINADFTALIVNLGIQETDIFETIYIHKNGTNVPTQLIVTKLNDIQKNVIGYLVIAQDLSEQKKLDKMKGEFISIVSHELRTPLTSIYGTLALLVESGLYQFTNEAFKLLKIASTNSKRLINLVNDILDIEKIEMGKMVFNLETIEINQLLKEAIILNQAISNSNSIRLRLINHAHAIIVNADRARLHQVLTNLISNAVKFSEPESEIILNIEVLPENKVKVAISDQGKGIPSSFHKHIFNKFSQADSSSVRHSEGTGLGLSICKAIIETLGGNIYFTSTLNKGSTFYFELPIAKIIA